MKPNHLRILLLAVLFLFFLQLSGTLIESIYILDLLNTTLDAKALGLLFFFAPLLLLPFGKKRPAWMLWLAPVLLMAARGVLPWLNTAGRLSAAGIGTAAALLLFPLLLGAKAPDKKDGYEISAGMALAGALSVLLRTVNFSLDYSLTPAGVWVGILLALGLGWLCLRTQRGAQAEANPRGFAAGLGLMLVLSLLLFAFSAPSVIARWTDGNYAVITAVVSLLALAYTAAALSRPDWVAALIANKTLLWGINLLLGAALVGTLLAHRVAFPLTPDALPVVVTPPTWLQQIPLALTLLLFPILFVDTALLMDSTRGKAKSANAFTGGLLVGILTLVVLIFMQIFTNVWGYVDPVSPFFRNKFWLPFALMAALLTLLVILRTPHCVLPEKVKNRLPLVWQIAMAAVFVVTAGIAFWTVRTPHPAPDKTALTVMTYNIQQANDSSGEKSYLRQLDMIRRINPDILALEESDSPRISLNNNDYVRYYASALGYYSYYGPATVTGTYGTAILSRYPLENVRTVFSYSDTDEIGTAEAEIVVDGRRFTIYCVHPDGSDAAMLTFADTLLNRSQGKENVIALGDYNLRSDEEAYQRIAAVYHNVPGSEGHIDHIFLSPDLQMVNPVYIPAPESATDHPLLFATVTWGQ